MNISALKTTHIILPGENLFSVLCKTLIENNKKVKNNSIIVIAETLVTTCQDSNVKLSEITEISEKAITLAKKYSMDKRYVQLIIEESDEIVGGIQKMLLCEKNGVLIANAGIDKSNVSGDESYSPWPKDPFGTARDLVTKIKKKFNIKNFGIIVSDSRVQPLRKGIVGVAIGVDGFEPVIDCRGKTDLFGHQMEWTQRALADQLTDAAHIVMGECDERTPFVLLEDVPVNFVDKPIEKDAMLFPKERDLFKEILKF